MGRSRHGAAMRSRLLAWTSFICVLAAVAILAAVAGLRSALVIVIGLAGLALMAVGAWWAFTHRGVMRVLGVIVALAAPAAVIVVYARNGLWPAVLASILLWAAALGCARGALRQDRRAVGMHATSAAPPRSPVLIMNPKSGGGKVGKFGLAAKADALGADVVLLDTATHQDVAAIARAAVADGADLLGVAGGDGTQALVADVAAEHDLPFVVICAGTRNHFAMDLGLDRDDPALSLDALTDGVELRIDLGQVAGRVFVNSASFGAYAEIVQSSAYRDAKTATALDAIPDLAAGDSGTRLSVLVDGKRLDNPQALLVSNNPYAMTDPRDATRRPRLDSQMLGVLAVHVAGAAQAADLALRGERARAITLLTAREVIVTADAERIPVALDGEALTLPTPVRCSIRPGALRVRVPRNRPGVPAVAPALDWKRVGQLALGRGEPVPDVVTHGDS